MISLTGVFENGEIELTVPENQKLPDSSEILITFLLDDENAPSTHNADSLKDSGGELVEGEEHDEGFYESIREFKRVKAHGDITIIEEETPVTHPLFDYSQGGLSFISEKKFGVGQKISAGITDPTNSEIVLMELEMEVRGMYSFEGGYKVGCMFLDPVDEDLWHGLLQFLT